MRSGTIITNVLRSKLQKEEIPIRFMWWMAADAMATFLQMLRRGLEPHGKESSARLLASHLAHIFAQRDQNLSIAHSHLRPDKEDKRQVALLMAGLYRTASRPQISWMLEPLGGAPHSFREYRQSEILLGHLTVAQRWNEVALHLGEILIHLTEHLPEDGLRGCNKILGAICFSGGRHYGLTMKRQFQLPQGAKAAIEVLRIGEYIFQVNPEHWSDTNAQDTHGFLEGNACLWYKRPGWQRLHCGIFGQFQSGIASAFGLRYQLTKTIPRHGGSHCRVELNPIGSKRSTEKPTHPLQVIP